MAISDWENTRRVTQLLEIEHHDSLDPAAADELLHDLCTDSAAAAGDDDDFRGGDKGGALPVVVGAPGEEAVDAAEDAEGDDVLEAGEERGVVAGERGEEGLPLRGVLEEKEGGERDGWVEKTVFEDVDECVELEEPWVRGVRGMAGSRKDGQTFTSDNGRGRHDRRSSLLVNA